jgi:hypothetical protein
MHDWTLVSILFEWKTARVILEFGTGGSKSQKPMAHGVSELHAPRLNDWGPSVSVNSVNKVAGPSDDASGRRGLEIEMQSGDHIRIVAKSFDFPQSAKVEETTVHAPSIRD